MSCGPSQVKSIVAPFAAAISSACASCTTVSPARHRSLCSRTAANDENLRCNACFGSFLVFFDETSTDEAAEVDDFEAIRAAESGCYCVLHLVLLREAPVEKKLVRPVPAFGLAFSFVFWMVM